jgi:hypothetical protein
MKRAAWWTVLMLAGCGATPPREQCVSERESEPPAARVAESEPVAESEEGPIVGVRRTRMTYDGRELIEILTANVGLMVPVPPPPPACTSRTLVDAELPSAGNVSVAVTGNRALVVVGVWPGSGGEHTRTWEIDLASGAMRDATLASEIAGRAVVRGGDLLLATWFQGRGVHFHGYGAHPAPPDSDLSGLGSIVGWIEGPDGSLWIWHHRAMSEAGDPIATLTRVHPDGHMESTHGETNGSFLGVLPDENGVTVWRTPLLGHHGDVTTVQRLSSSLVLERDIIVREHVSGLGCPFFFASGANEGRLVCANGDTWTLRSGSVAPSLAFGDSVVAAAGSDVDAAVAARLDREAHELVLETFGGAFARFPLHGAELIGADVDVDGPHVVAAWLDGADRDAAQRHFEIRALDCVPP